MKRQLVVNAGSATLKWTLFGAGRAKLDGGVVSWNSAEPEHCGAQMRELLRGIGEFEAAGHRLVHGGARYTAPVALTGEVRAQLQALCALDPDHMRPALACIDTVAGACPQVTQFASFDTAFHATLPEAAARYALPREWIDRWQLRRYGFHGLSVDYSVRRVRELLGMVPARMVVCHLGSGCSLTAVRDGRSVDTTMGYTPLDGPVMATRSGAIDPGLLLQVQRQAGLDADAMQDALTHRSGLLALSGISGDLGQVLAAAGRGDQRAASAYDCFLHSLRRYLGAMIAVLQGVDAVVFTGGMAEHSPRLRQDLCETLRFAGLEIDPGKNREGASDRLISAPRASIAAYLIHAREDRVVLDDLLRLTSKDTA
ncbi:MAG TPA: acetate/propionate family kinase [Nevskiaceae bacterium]|nr:acetate/propionate family kinase [Nevskiaceae bacterium]